MEIRICNCSPRDLSIKSTGMPTHAVPPLSMMGKALRDCVKLDISANEVLFLNLRVGGSEPFVIVTPFVVKIGNCGDRDLIAEVQSRFMRALSPLSFGQRVSRNYIELELYAHETLVLRTRGAKDPEGVEIRTPV